MATQTPNLNLVLPDYSDKADVGVLNENFKKIDNFSGGGKVEEWLKDIRVKADESLKEIQTKATESLNDIENKANNALASIPDDYETIYNDVSSLKDQKADKAAVDLNGGNSVEIWEQGSISDGNGKPVTTTTRIRIVSFLSDAVNNVSSIWPWSFKVFAYDKDEKYVGTWNGSEFASTSTWVKKFDVSAYGNDYKLKLTMRRDNDANITPDAATIQNIRFDTALTVKFGQIDAEVKEIYADIDRLNVDINDVSFWVNGGISSNNEEYTEPNILRTIGYIPKETKLICAEKNYVFFAVCYDADDNLVGTWDGEGFGPSTTSIRYLIPDGLEDYNIRLMLRSTNGGSITPQDSVNVHFYTEAFAKAFYPTPTLTFIDDDGSLNALENWESISDEIGVKITSCLVTGVMGDGVNNPEKASWEDVARLQNKGFEFVSHTHNHINITERTEEVVEQQFKDSIAALREHGCESRYLVYPYNAINTERIPLVRKYFRAGVGLGNDTDNPLPLYTYWIRRHSINSGEFVDVQYEGETVSAHAFHSYDTLKGYIDAAFANGSWVIIMTHLRNDGVFYHDEESRQMIIDLCKYAIEKGMMIQTFGEAFERYKNVMEINTIYSGNYYIVDCNGVPHYRGQV